MSAFTKSDGIDSEFSPKLSSGWFGLVACRTLFAVRYRDLVEVNMVEKVLDGYLSPHRRSVERLRICWSVIGWWQRRISDVVKLRFFQSLRMSTSHFLFLSQSPPIRYLSLYHSQRKVVLLLKSLPPFQKELHSHSPLVRLSYTGLGAISCARFLHLDGHRQFLWFYKEKTSS